MSGFHSKENKGTSIVPKDHLMSSSEYVEILKAGVEITKQPLKPSEVSAGHLFFFHHKKRFFRQVNRKDLIDCKGFKKSGPLVTNKRRHEQNQPFHYNGVDNCLLFLQRYTCQQPTANVVITTLAIRRPVVDANGVEIPWSDELSKTMPSKEETDHSAPDEDNTKITEWDSEGFNRTYLLHVTQKQAPLSTFDPEALNQSPPMGKVKMAAGAASNGLSVKHSGGLEFQKAEDFDGPKRRRLTASAPGGDALGLEDHGSAGSNYQGMLGSGGLGMGQAAGHIGSFGKTGPGVYSGLDSASAQDRLAMMNYRTMQASQQYGQQGLAGGAFAGVDFNQMQGYPAGMMNNNSSAGWGESLNSSKGPVADFRMCAGSRKAQNVASFIQASIELSHHFMLQGDPQRCALYLELAYDNLRFLGVVPDEFQRARVNVLLKTFECGLVSMQQGMLHNDCLQTFHSMVMNIVENSESNAMGAITPFLVTCTAFVQCLIGNAGGKEYMSESLRHVNLEAKKITACTYFVHGIYHLAFGDGTKTASWFFEQAEPFLDLEWPFVDVMFYPVCLYFESLCAYFVQDRAAHEKYAKLLSRAYSTEEKWSTVVIMVLVVVSRLLMNIDWRVPYTPVAKLLRQLYKIYSSTKSIPVPKYLTFYLSFLTLTAYREGHEDAFNHFLCSTVRGLSSFYKQFTGGNVFPFNWICVMSAMLTLYSEILEDTRNRGTDDSPRSLAGSPNDAKDKDGKASKSSKEDGNPAADKDARGVDNTDHNDSPPVNAPTKHASSSPTSGGPSDPADVEETAPLKHRLSIREWMSLLEMASFLKMYPLCVLQAPVLQSKLTRLIELVDESTDSVKLEAMAALEANASMPAEVAAQMDAANYVGTVPQTPTPFSTHHTELMSAMQRRRMLAEENGSMGLSAANGDDVKALTALGSRGDDVANQIFSTFAGNGVGTSSASSAQGARRMSNSSPTAGLDFYTNFNTSGRVGGMRGSNSGASLAGSDYCADILPGLSSSSFPSPVHAWSSSATGGLTGMAQNSWSPRGRGNSSSTAGASTARSASGFDMPFSLQNFHSEG